MEFLGGFSIYQRYNRSKLKPHHFRVIVTINRQRRVLAGVGWGREYEKSNLFQTPLYLLETLSLVLPSNLFFSCSDNILVTQLTLTLNLAFRPVFVCKALILITLLGNPQCSFGNGERLPKQRHIQLVVISKRAQTRDQLLQSFLHLAPRARVVTKL